MPENDTLRERLAEQAHKSWSNWMILLLGRCDVPTSHTRQRRLFIPCNNVEQWRRQMMGTYAELTEEEKEIHRREADKYLAVFNWKPAADQVPKPVLYQTQGEENSVPWLCDLRAALDGKGDWEAEYAQRGHSEYIENVHALVDYCKAAGVSLARARLVATWKTR